MAHKFLKLLTISTAACAGYYAYNKYKKQNEALEDELAGEFDDSELEDDDRAYSDIPVEDSPEEAPEASEEA